MRTERTWTADEQACFEQGVREMQARVEAAMAGRQPRFGYRDKRKAGVAVTEQIAIANRAGSTDP